MRKRDHIIKLCEGKEIVVAAKLSKKRLQIDQFFCETRLENRNGLRNVGHWLRIIHARRLAAPRLIITH